MNLNSTILIFTFIAGLLFESNGLKAGVPISGKKNLADISVSYLLSDKSPIKISNTEFFIDKEKAISVEDLVRLEKEGSISWKTTDKLNFGYVPYRIWLRFKVSNPTDTTDWILEHQFPITQYIHFYIQDSKGIKHTWTGTARPFNERPILHKNFLFPLELQSNNTAMILMSFESAGPIMGMLRILSKETSISETGRDLILYGLYYGILIAMILYNFFLFFGTRYFVYLFYVLHTLSFCLFHMCLSGVAYQYLWPHSAQWNHMARYILIPLSYLFIGIFTKLFLETKKYSRLADSILTGTIVIAGFLTLLPIVVCNYQITKLIGFTYFLSPLFLFAVSILCYRSGAKNVKYFITAFAGIFVANLIYGAQAIGFLKDNFITNHGIQIASTAEVFLFSLALVARIKRLQEEQEKERSVAKIASEISHNIKSPLATLNAVIPLIRDSDESIRILIRYATNSITDLANQLLEIRRSSEMRTKKHSHLLVQSVNCELITGVVEQVISLKKIEYCQYDLIHYHSHSKDPLLFVSIDAIQFRSILSNLINNAVEAIDKCGRIDVSIYSDEHTVRIEVGDNGKGMSPEKIETILNCSGVSDKPKGNGLGLVHAIECIKSWGGEITLDSHLSKGTRVTIHLPRAQAPSRFVSKIEIHSNTTIVVLDDDVSIHKIWDQRFLNELQMAGIKIEHFTDSNELKKKLPLLLQNNPLFLIDQELLRQEITGLEFIISHGIKKQSILVTSRWDEQDVIQTSQTEDIHILPKFLAGQIPISLKQEVSKLEKSELVQLDAVLIDDDFLVRLTWEQSAKACGKQIRTFETLSDFEQVCSNFDKSIKIFVDYYLNGDPGIKVSRTIYDKGFSNLYLATGVDSNDLPPLSSMPWLRGIQGKNPYWLDTPV